MSACLEPYPDYSGPLDVSGSKVAIAIRGKGDMKFMYNLEGTESDCVDCGIHIHSGVSCEVADNVGGHFWDLNLTPVDMWTPTGGAVYNSDSDGKAKGSFEIQNGFKYTYNKGVVVIHKQDGERIGCGILSKSKKSC